MTIKIEALVEEIPRTIECGNVFVREGVGAVIGFGLD
jgi:delta 1-pyrroline-5-carboxylate dehydrogenase